MTIPTILVKFNWPSVYCRWILRMSCMLNCVIKTYRRRKCRRRVGKAAKESSGKICPDDKWEEETRALCWQQRIFEVNSTNGIESLNDSTQIMDIKFLFLNNYYRSESSSNRHANSTKQVSSTAPAVAVKPQLSFWESMFSSGGTLCFLIHYMYIICYDRLGTFDKCQSYSRDGGADCGENDCTQWNFKREIGRASNRNGEKQVEII